jgi:anti-anti-sigma factor
MVAMEISVSQHEARVPVAVFQIKGPVINNEPLEQQVRSAYNAGARNIVLDLSEVPYMASAGLRALHAIYSLLRSDTAEESDEATKRGIAAGTFVSPHLKLVKPTPYVLEVLKSAGYDMFLEIHRDLSQALDAF